MANDSDEITRREAIKSIGAGVGVIATLPVLGSAGVSDEKAGHDHTQHSGSAKQVEAAPQPLKFFTPEENKALIEMSERIIPADDTPGATAAGVPAFIAHMLANWYDPPERTRVIEQDHVPCPVNEAHQ